MIPWLPGSPSLILSAPLIVETRVVSAQAEEWQDSAPFVVERSVALTLDVIRVWKGQPVAIGSTLRLTVTQYESRAPLGSGVPGAWSGQSIEPGTAQIVFTRANELTPEALVEPARVFAADEARSDVALAERAEREELLLETVTQIATDEGAGLHALFPQYLWARDGERAVRQEEARENVLGFLESKTLANVARGALLDAILDSVAFSASMPDAFIDRLVISLFRLVALPEAEELRTNILRPYLPNLLGLGSGMPLRSAQTVFAQDPAARRWAEGTLRAQPADSSTAVLLQWFAAEGE